MDAEDQRWQEALYRRQVLEPLLGLSVVSNAGLAEAAERLGLSPRQVRSLLARFRVDPRTSALLRQPGGRPTGLLRLDKLREALIAEVMASRPDAERVHFIHAERWIGFPRAELGLSLLRDLIQHPPCARMPCLLIHGDSGMGKTKIVERFRRDFPDDFDTEQGRALRPVVVMEMPPGPGEQRFHGQLLATLNAQGNRAMWGVDRRPLAKVTGGG